MMKKLLVSILMPAYNAEKYIQRAIKSLFVQTYPTIEIIVINDGSTDHTLRILNQLSKGDDRLKVYTTSNVGPGSARNIGIERATGTYFTFLDADDVMLCDNIENFIKKIKIFSYDLIFSHHINMFEEKLIKISKNIHTDDKFHALNDLLSVYPSMVWKCLFKTQFVKSHHIKFQPRENILIGEDTLFIMEALIKADTWDYSNHFSVYYYINPDSLVNCRKEYLEILKDNVAKYHKIAELLRNTGFDTNVMKTTLNENFVSSIFAHLLNYSVERRYGTKDIWGILKNHASFNVRQYCIQVLKADSAFSMKIKALILISNSAWIFKNLVFLKIMKNSTQGHVRHFKEVIYNEKSCT